MRLSGWLDGRMPLFLPIIIKYQKRTGGAEMRGVHSDIDDTRRSVFREVARLAYEGGDYSRVDQIPYKLVPNGSTAMQYDVFLDRAVVAARVKLALGMELHTDAPGEIKSILRSRWSISSHLPAMPAQRSMSASPTAARAAFRTRA